MIRIDQIESQAIEWLFRLREGERIDWEELTRWLEACPSHREAFDRLSLIDSQLEGLSLPEEIRSTGKRRSWLVAAALGSAVAASLVTIVVIPRSEPYRVETQAGEHRMLSLPDGSRAELNGGTVIVLDKRRPRLASLERGEAFFSVVHDPQDPFTVRAGAARIVDVGTTFNVIRTADSTEIGVSDGAISFQSANGSVQVRRGLELRVQGSQATLSHISPGSVGSWREGQLVYVDAPLRTLAADIQRTRGLSVRVDPSLAGRRFSGTIEVSGPDSELVRRVAVLTGTEALRVQGGWALTSPRVVRS